MKGETSGNELHSLLDAIKSSEVVESRAQLITELGKLDINEDSELSSIVESLTWIFWEDYTCLDASQCMLNKNILQVAATYLDSGLFRCLGQFLALGTKASLWCGKHLKMTVMSIEESQEEEHFNLFFQLLLLLLSYSSASFSALARYPVSNSKVVMVAIEKFFSEQLNLTKECLLEIMRINSFASDVLKAVQVVLDAAIRLCRVYCNGVNWDLYDARAKEDKDCMERDDFETVKHVTSITKCAVEKLCEVGILAANDGGNLVSVLNLSWKGVVQLLQLGSGTLASKLNIANIILSLITQAKNNLRCAAESWSCPLKEKVPVTEAKRIFLPVKFFLINAVRIISHYPSQAFSVYKDIILCVIMISTFRISLSKEEFLKSANEALAELLELTSFHLLNSLLNSAQLGEEHKFQILNWLCSDETDLHFIFGDPSSKHRESSSMGAIFSVSCDNMCGARALLSGRLFLFLNLLKGSPDLEHDLRVGISMKLRWLMNVIIDEDIYSSILVLRIPVLYGSDQRQEFSYQPLYFFVIHALKTFMVVVSSTIAWRETLSFLLGNIFHPHFLCWEIGMELLCFMIRHAEIDLVKDIIDKLCLLLEVATFPESVYIPGSGLRKIARSVCVLLTHCSESTVDLVYRFITCKNSSSNFSSSAYVALLLEGFPLNSLSDKVKSAAEERLVSEYFGFLDGFVDESPIVSVSGAYGMPVFAFSAALQSLQVSISDTNMKTLHLLLAFINKYRNSEGKMKDHYRKLLSETLGIISMMKHIYESDEMERVVIELRKLFISRPVVSDDELFQCKPNLAVFMAGLCHIELAEDDDCSKSSSVWELYHMLLRERHWAFVHLAVKAFGYFASRTNCNQLWRFVPQDAALSFDMDSGKEANEERFMSELKGFLEKEAAHLALTPGSDQPVLLVREAKLLLENIEKTLKFEPHVMICEPMEVDDEKRANKKRKLPEVIDKGVELLQSGLKIIGDGLSLWQQNNAETTELHDKLLSHVASLEDVIGHLVSLSGCE